MKPVHRGIDTGAGHTACAAVKWDEVLKSPHIFKSVMHAKAGNQKLMRLQHLKI